MKPINSENIKDGLSTTNSKLVPKRDSLPDISFLNKIKLSISEKVTLVIRRYDTGFVSLFIVLLKLNKSTAIKQDAIMGRKGINQVIFNSIVLNQDYFYTQL